MSDESLKEKIYLSLCELPLLDVHTHLIGNRLGAGGLHDIAIYHMAVSELYSAGCPNGARLTQYPGIPDTAEAHSRITEALPYFHLVKNTGISWGIRIILGELYGFNEPLTENNWRRIDSLIRERAGDAQWHREILKRAGIAHLCTEIARRENGQADDILDYSLEWAFFTRCQWGEYDTALYELERCWGKTPESPMPIGSGARPETERVIQTLDDVHKAVDHYVNAIPYDRIKSMATHISTDLDLSPATSGQMKEALSSRKSAGAKERDIYASYINELFLSKLEKRGGDIIFQFSYGAEPLKYETASRLSQRSISQLAEIVTRHPGLRFQCFLSSLHANQSLCTLCREIPNLSMAGYWWHNFFPFGIRRIIEERLDMLPLNRQAGFFSDAYCVEWAYAKAKLVRLQMAEVLSSKISQEQYSFFDAVDIAKNIFYEMPKQYLKIK